MKQVLKNALLLGCCIASLSACSVNPTPTKTFGLPTTADITNQIIHRTRCEARDAMIVRAAKLLQELETAQDSQVVYADGNSLPVSEQWLNDPSKIKQYKEWELDPLLYIIASPILRSSLGMDFTFTITENNNDTFSPELTSTIGTNIFTLGIASQQMERARQNLRSMPVRSRTFAAFQELDCEGDFKTKSKNTEKRDRKKINNRKNPTYPLKGNIQLEKTINTFIDFVLIDANRGPKGTRTRYAQNALSIAAGELLPEGQIAIDLDAAGNKSKAAEQRARKKLDQIRADLSHKHCIDGESCKEATACYSYVLQRASDLYITKLYSQYDIPAAKGITTSDTLKFTTKIAGGIEPKLVYGRPSSLDIETVAFSFKPSRTDIHQVKINMTAAIPPKKATKSEFVSLITGANGNQFFAKKETEADDQGPVKACAKYEDRKNKKSTSNPSPSMVSDSSNAFPVVKDTQEAEFIKQRSIENDNLNVNIERLIQSGGALPLQ